MSKKHPVIAVTGSSGAGTTFVKRAFENIFRQYDINAAIIEGDSLHSLGRMEFRERMKAEEAKGNKHFSHFGPETITPSHPGIGSWEPGSRTIDSVGANTPDQDFVGTPKACTIGGTVKLKGSPWTIANLVLRINSVNVPVTTDGQGRYTLTKDYTILSYDGYTIEPILAGYIVLPLYRLYRPLTSDLIEEDYTAWALPDWSLVHMFYEEAEGVRPDGSLTAVGSVLYGVTSQGGSGGGTVFRVNIDGTGFAVLHSFTGGTSDGLYPRGSLLELGGVLYGTTSQGGSASKGTIYKINIDGTGFALIHNFAGTANDTISPSSLLESGGMLYGVTRYGGASDSGKIFRIGKDGTGFTLLHSFDPYSYPSGSLLESATPAPAQEQAPVQLAWDRVGDRERGWV